jgi:hypothetical protein
MPCNDDDDDDDDMQAGNEGKVTITKTKDQYNAKLKQYHVHLEELADLRRLLS